jgi:hypothetical protein
LGYAGAGEEGLSRYVTKDGILLRGVAPNDVTWLTKDPSKTYYDDGKFTTRDDASLDSLCGFLFGVAVAHRNGRLIPPLKNAMKRLADRFVADGYRLKKVDGGFTTYGDCRPGIFQAPVRNLAAALVSYWGETCGADTPGWRQICLDHNKEFENLETHVLWKHAWYNDHLAILTACAGYMAESIFFYPARKGFDRLLVKHTKTGNAFLIQMAQYLGETLSQEQVGISMKVLLEFTDTPVPNGKSAVTVKNEDYPSVKWDGQRVAKQPVPAWRRPPADYFWQRNPYSLEGASYENYSGLDFLMAYTLRRRS